MTYRALYRTFRPSRFADLIGQERIARTLQNALRMERLAHAYLFCGPRGTGKTSTAKILAKAVNCLNPGDGEPCGVCANCTAIAADHFLDVVEIDAASNRGIDEMRDLKEQVRFVPSIGRRKVYIIDEVHMLTSEAFNALLKTLEEPPPHVLFILATTDPQKVPPTVLSRTQRFDFRKISETAITGHLTDIARAEGIDAEPTALAAIARAAAGGMRDAVSLLDQAISYAGDRLTRQDVTDIIGGVPEHVFIAWTDAMAEHDYAHLLDTAHDATLNGGDPKSMLNGFVDWLRQLFRLRVAPQGMRSLDPTVREDVERQARFFTPRQFETLLRSLAKGEANMRYAPDTELVLEITLMDALLGLSEPAATPPTAPAPTSPPPGLTQAARPTPPTNTVPAEEPPATADAPAAAPEPRTPPLESPDVATADPPPETLDEAELPALFQTVMTQLKGESVRLHAFMKPAQVVGIEGGRLVLRFPKDSNFHHQQMSRPENLELLNRLLSDAAGQRLKARLDIEQDETEQFDLVAETERIFGKDKVTVSNKDPIDLL